MWTIAPIHVRRGWLPEGSCRIEEMTAGAAVATYLLRFKHTGPLDVVVRCTLARFHFFVHIMRGRRGQIALYSIAGKAAHGRQRVDKAL